MATDPAAYELGIKFNLNVNDAISDLKNLEDSVERIFINAGKKAIKLNIDLNAVSKSASEAIVASAMQPLSIEKTIATQAATPATSVETTQNAAATAASSAAIDPSISLDAAQLARKMEELHNIGAEMKSDFGGLRVIMDKLDQSMDAGENATWKLATQLAEYNEITQTHINLQQKLSRQRHISEGDALAIEESANLLKNTEDKLNKAIEKRIRTGKKLSEEEKQLIGFGLQQTKVLRIETETTEKAIKAIKAKGTASRILSTATQSLSTVVGEASGGINALAASIRTAMFSESLFAAALPLITISLQELMQVQDKYVKANFRAVGSVTDLMHVNTNLQRKLALTSGEAQKTIASMVDAGVSARDFGNGAKESFEDAAIAVHRFSVVTGASEQSTAKFAKTGIVAFGSMQKTTKVMGSLVNAMEAGGLSTEDMNGILEKLNTQLIGVRGTMGVAGAEKYAKAMAAASVTAKQLGMDVKLLTELVESSANPWAMLESRLANLHIMAGNLDASFKGTKSSTEMTTDAFKELGRQMAEADEANGNGAEGRASSIIELEYLGYTTAELSGHFASLDKVLGESGKTFGTVEEKAQALADVMIKNQNAIDKDADLQKKWEDSTKTLTMAVKKLVFPLIALAEKALIPLIWVVTEIVGIFMTFDNALGGVPSALIGIGIAAYFLIPSLVAVAVKLWSLAAALVSKGLIGGFKSIASGALDAGKSLFGMGKKAAELTTNIGPAGDAMKGAGEKAANLGKTASPSLGAKISNFFRGLANGLKSMADPKVIIGMFVVVVGLGALAFILVKLVEHLAGFELTALAASAAMIGMAFAFYLLSPAIVALAGAATVGFVPLAGLALVMLGMGAAAWLAGLGMSYVIDSLVGLFAVLTVDNATAAVILSGAFVLMAFGLGALGLSMLAVPFIVAGLLSLYATAWWVNDSLTTLASSMEKLSIAGPGLAMAGNGIQLLTNSLWSLSGVDVDKFDRINDSLTKLSWSGYGIWQAGYGMGLLADNLAKVNALTPVKFPLMENKDEQARRAEKERIDTADKTNKKLDGILDKISEDGLSALMDLLAPSLSDIIRKLDKDKSLSSNINQWA